MDSSGNSGPGVLPGSIVLRPKDFPDSTLGQESEARKWLQALNEKKLLSDGILVNSFRELESEAFRALEMGRCPPVYPIGPLIRTGFESESDSSVCLKWLDDQPLQSVLYVAFGSYWTLSPEQLTELAMGLEMSEQRFLWVVRRPEIEINPNNDTLDYYLPQGFMERTKGRGLVVWSWAPQLRIRSHGSIGGFLTHCGWSSILESVAFGVPMIAWPLIFDQKMNAVFVGDGLKAGIRVEKNENGIVERGHISLLVKKLMGSEEGKRIRERIMDIKIAAQKAVSKEGSSTLAQVVKSWSSEN